MKDKIIVNLVDGAMPIGESVDMLNTHIEESFYLGKLHKKDYSNIFLNNTVTTSDVAKALDVIATYFMQNGSNRICLDLEKRNEELAPAREMTLTEIEEILGYNIKIVNEESID